MCHKARYSWVVLAASFVAHYLLYGVTYGLGVFYVIIMETFQAGPTEVSLLCSLFTAVFFGAGRHTAGWLGPKQNTLRRNEGREGANLRPVAIYGPAQSQNIQSLLFSPVNKSKQEGVRLKNGKDKRKDEMKKEQQKQHSCSQLYIMFCTSSRLFTTLGGIQKMNLFMQLHVLFNYLFAGHN